MQFLKTRCLWPEEAKTCRIDRFIFKQAQIARGISGFVSAGLVNSNLPLSLPCRGLFSALGIGFGAGLGAGGLSPGIVDIALTSI